MRRLLVIFSILSIIFTSCEKKLDIDLPDSEKHIVVNGMFNPDSLLQVRVTKSRNVLDTSRFIFLSDAIVKLFANDVYQETLTHKGEGYFQSTFYPQPDIEYTLTVDYTGMNSVSSMSSFMYPTQILSLDTLTETIITNYDYGYSDTANYLYIDLKIKDNPVIENYYFISVTSMQPVYEYDGYNNIFVGFQELSEYFQSEDPALSSNVNDYAIDGSSGKICSDDLFNGSEHTFDLKIYLNRYFYMENPLNEVKFYIKLYTVNEDLFKFIRSYNLNRETGFDPFAQPVQIYTNIENGLGLFIGYSVDLDSLTIQY